MCKGVCRPEDNLKYYPEKCHQLPSKQGLSLAWDSPVRLAWLAISRDCPVSTFPELGLKIYISKPNFYMGVEDATRILH